MKILIASDKYKECLSSIEVAENLSYGLRNASQDFEIKCLAIADGGEGTSDALIEVMKGEKITCKVNDPLMRMITASYGILPDKNTAVIEMAKASGIELLKEDERNPWNTTSFGTGELILDAMNRGCSRFIIGIGGSATNDGGMGMASALGFKFLDSKGIEIDQGGGALSMLEYIQIDKVHKGLKDSEILVACDVSNPLTGKNGASIVFGPQKGANSEMALKLDNNLLRFAKVVKRDLGVDVNNIPGSGAAGGLGAGLLAFLNARLERGFDIVRKEIDLDKYCEWADIIFTGEGKLDYQTAFGKVPCGVASVAKQYKKPVIAIAGSLGENFQQLYSAGIDAIFSIQNKTMSLEESILNAPELLKETGYSIGKLLFLKK